MFGTFYGSQSIYSVGAYCGGVGIKGNHMTLVMLFFKTHQQRVLCYLCFGFFVFVLCVCVCDVA